MEHMAARNDRVTSGKADRRADLPFLVITLTLLGVGVVMVLSASFASAYYDLQGETGHNPVYFFSRQAIFAAAGVCVMLIASRIPMRVYRACALPLLIVSLVSLAAVLVIGTVVNGARRWISLGFTTFQPSEITKIAIILYFSALICKYKDRMRTFRYGIAPFAAILAVVSALLVLEPHFSATIIILAIGASMLFLGGVRLHWFIGAAGVLLVGAVAAVLAITQFTKGLGVLRRIPTRLLSYIYAVIIMLAAEYFTGTLTLSAAALLPVNAIIVATSASGGYDTLRAVGKNGKRTAAAVGTGTTVGTGKTVNAGTAVNSGMTVSSGTAVGAGAITDADTANTSDGSTAGDTASDAVSRRSAQAEKQTVCK